jgi:hypothetical protein
MHACVIEHELLPLPRGVRIDGQVTGPGFENAQHSDDHFQRGFDTNTYQLIRQDAAVAEMVCESIGPRIECLVRELPVFEHHGDGVGSSSNLLFEQFVQALVTPAVGAGSVPI